MKIVHLFPLLLSVSLGITQSSTQGMLPFLDGFQGSLSDMGYNTAFVLSLYGLSGLLDNSYDYMTRFLFGDSADQFLDQLNLCYNDNTMSFLQTKQSIPDVITGILEGVNDISPDSFCLGGDFGRKTITIILQELYEDILGCDEFDVNYISIIESYLGEDGANTDGDGLSLVLEEGMSDLRDNLDSVLSQICSSLNLIGN